MSDNHLLYSNNGYNFHFRSAFCDPGNINYQIKNFPKSQFFCKVKGLDYMISNNLLSCDVLGFSDSFWDKWLSAQFQHDIVS